MAKYTLPAAGPDRLGGVMVGDDFKIESDGTLNIKDMDTMKLHVAELSRMAADGKAEIASAITDMGVETAADDTFSVMSENIRNISCGVSQSVIGDFILRDFTVAEG